MSRRKRRVFSPEFKDEAVRMVLHHPEGPQPVGKIARQLSINEQTLRNWVRVYEEKNPGKEPALTVNERARLRELERKVLELEDENRFLGKAVAFFAREHR